MLVLAVDDEPRDVLPIQTFSIAEGLRQVPYGDTMVVARVVYFVVTGAISITMS